MSSGVSSDTSRNQFRNWASCEQARRCFETTTTTSQGACSSGFLRELHQNKKVDISLLSWHFSFALLWHPLTIGKLLQETDRLSAMRSRTQGIRPSTCQSSAGYPGEQMSFDKGTNCCMLCKRLQVTWNMYESTRSTFRVIMARIRRRLVGPKA